MRAVGIILAGGNNHRMKELSSKRAIAAMPVGGAFRSIDFALSSMSNSHIQKVAVLTQYNARSLNEHLNSSKWWDFGRKQGGLFLFPPTLTASNTFWYRGTADAMIQNLNWLRRCHEPYVVIASGDGVYKIDFNKVLEYHIAKRADITVVCTECRRDDPRRFGTLRLDANDRILEFEEKPMVTKSDLISTGIYIIRRRQLIEMLEQCEMEDRYDFVKDILIRYKDLKEMYGYRLMTYWSNIASVDSYYRTNMDFLDPDVRNYFFHKDPGVYSKLDDSPPAKYNSGSNVRNSLVASGCIINGTVENSVLFGQVYVGENCTIRNSIVLNDVYIGDNSSIENCIVESRGTIAAGSHFAGEGGVRIVIEKRERYHIGGEL